jgi:hypothetical protein
MRARKPWVRRRLIRLGWYVRFISFPFVVRAAALLGALATLYSEVVTPDWDGHPLRSDSSRKRVDFPIAFCYFIAVDRPFAQG